MSMSPFSGTIPYYIPRNLDFMDFRKLIPYISLITLPKGFEANILKPNILMFLHKTESHNKGGESFLSVQFSSVLPPKEF